MVTLYPLACSNLAREAEIIPFPSDDVTPPVTKMYLVEGIFICFEVITEPESYITVNILLVTNRFLLDPH